MFHKSGATVVAVTAAIALSLSGCSLLETPGEEPLTGLAACALGHSWQADLTDIAAQVLVILQEDGVPVTAVTAEGIQSLDWTLNSRVTLVTDYVVTVTITPAADQVLTIVETHSGTSTGAAFINGEVAIPRTWDGSGVTIDTIADNNGVPVEEITVEIPATSFDDAVGLELTCSGSEMTVHPRGSQVIQKWSR